MKRQAFCYSMSLLLIAWGSGCQMAGLLRENTAGIKATTEAIGTNTKAVTATTQTMQELESGLQQVGSLKGPMQDLAALTRYAAQELVDPTLAACWQFDETEGITVCNSAQTYPADLVGNPIWRPQGGAVGGAIELDGVDDCVMVSFQGGDLVKGPLSVFAWVKGGKPGQVIFSQQATANWLVATVPTGALATELRGPVRGGGPLSSQTVITDGKWHRVGLVWDGKRRALYVDGACVAEDVQENLKILYANLTIGAGKDLTAGTFWSGLIDDVRIYNRVVKP